MKLGAVETPIGFLPHPEGIDTRGTKLSPAAMKELLTVEREGWLQAAAGQREFFGQFGDRMPRELWQESEALTRRLQG